MRKSQVQMFYEAGKKIAAGNDAMMDLIRDGDISNDELQKLIDKRPDKYGRFQGFVGKLPVAV